MPINFHEGFGIAFSLRIGHSGQIYQVDSQPPFMNSVDALIAVIHRSIFLQLLSHVVK